MREKLKNEEKLKEANKQLAFLRRDYARKVKEIRKEYIKEMELQRIEKLRKDEAIKEALRIENEEKRATKAAKKKAEAIERQAAEEEFRQMLEIGIKIKNIALLKPSKTAASDFGSGTKLHIESGRNKPHADLEFQMLSNLEHQLFLRGLEKL